MKRIILCINPQAGAGKSKSKLFDIVNSLNDLECEVMVYTIVPGHRSAENILSITRDDYDVYVCCGGDGTLNRFINACKVFNIHRPIGYYPFGSTNDFARTIWKDPSVINISQSIANGDAFSYDLGKFNDTYFNYIAAFGAFTGVSYNTEQRFKNAFGYMAYVVNGIASLPQSLSNSIELTYTVDETSRHGKYIFGSVSNTTSIGGFSSPIMKRAELDDGLFEVILVKAPENVYELAEIVASLSTGAVNEKYMEVFQTASIEFVFDTPVHWTLDGEDSGEKENVRIDVEKKGMQLML